MKKVISFLNGGIGNQMFQYAFAKYISIKTNRILLLNLTQFNRNNENGLENRIFELENFKIKYKSDEKSIDYYIKKSIQKFSFKNKYHLLEDFNTSREINFLSLKGDIILNGYWQSEDYFKNIEKVIKENFIPAETLDYINNSLIHEIKNTCSVSLHIRRGDYLRPNSRQSICELEYYTEAIKFITAQNNKIKIFIFSDDIDWCRSNLNVSHPHCFINHNDGRNSYKDIFLMSNCKHNIIANSTFSWWGAWLNNNPSKIIIAPKQWFNDQNINMTKTKELIPEGWIRI